MKAMNLAVHIFQETPVIHVWLTAHPSPSGLGFKNVQCLRHFCLEVLELSQGAYLDQ